MNALNGEGVDDFILRIKEYFYNYLPYVREKKYFSNIARRCYPNSAKLTRKHLTRKSI